MAYKQYILVRLLTDKYRTEGAKSGDIGAIIEAYDDGYYEIEFSDRSGISFAQIVAHEDEIEPVGN